MRSRVKRRRWLALVLVPCYLMGCSRWQVYHASPQQLFAAEDPDKIRVTMNDSTTFEMRQSRVVGDSLTGSVKFPVLDEGARAGTTGPYTVALADIAHISTKKSDATLTVTLIVVTVGALLAAGYVAFADAMSHSR